MPRRGCGRWSADEAKEMEMRRETTEVSRGVGRY
jgi:hypothetical protein